MVAARTLKSKEALEELVEAGEDVEDIEIAASNAEMALNSIGLTARDETGDMKDLQVVLGEVAEKWEGLSKATKQYVSEQLAGNNRRNYIVGLLDNYSRVLELEEIAQNSSGALMEASEKQANSLEGRLNTLTNAWTSLYETMINSGTAKAGVSALATVINALAVAMKNLHVTLPVATTALIAFKAAMNGWTIADQVQWIGMLAKETLGNLITKLTAATGATNLFSLALAGLKSVGIGAIVGVAIWGITSYISKAKEAITTTEDLQDAIGNSYKRMEQLQDASDKNSTTLFAIGDIERANQELQNLTVGTDEYNEKQKLINETLSEMASLHADSEYASLLESELVPLEKKLELLKLITEQEMEQAKNEARDNFFDTKTDMDGLYGKATAETGKLSKANNDKGKGMFFDPFGLQEKATKEAEEALKNLELIYDDALVRMEEAKLNHDLGIITDDEFAHEQEKFDELVAYFQERSELAGILVEDVEASTEELGGHIDELTPKLESFFDSDNFDANNFASTMQNINTLLQATEYSAEDASNGLEVLKNQFPDLVGQAESLGEAVSTLNTKALNEVYAEQISSLEEVQSLLDAINEEGLNAANISTLQGSELMSDYTGAITDAVSITDHLKNKFQELQDAQYETCTAMVLNNGNAWNEMTNQMAESLGIQNSTFANSLGIQEGEFANYVNSLGGMRQVDIQNAVSSADAQAQAELDLCRQGAFYYASFINDKAGGRQIDMTNVAEFLNQQEVKEAKTVDDLKRMWQQYYNAKRQTIQAELNDLSGKLDKMAGDYDDQGNIDPATMASWNNLRNQLRQLENTNNAMTNYFDNINTNLSGVSSGLNQALTSANNIANNVIGGGSGGSGGSSYKPSSASSSRPSSGSSSSRPSSSGGSSSTSQKVVEDLDLEIDRYYALNDAIENVNKALAKNSALQENVSSKEEYKKLIQEELDLLAQKQKALENLRAEQEKERDELKNTLQSNGFKFDSNNNITNYAQRLKELQNWANSFTDADQKESAIAQVNEIKKLIDAYTTLEDSTIPSTTEEINSLKNEVISINKEFEKNMKLIDTLGDRYFDLLRKIAKLDNALELNQAKQDNATDREKIELLDEEIRLLLERQKLINEQKAEYSKEASELKKQLQDKGVQFDNGGNITNYKSLVQSLENKANGLVGDAQSEAVQDANDLLDLIDKYVTLTEDTIPDLEVAWEDYTSQIKDSQEEIEDIIHSFKESVVNVQKDIASAYEYYQNKRYDKLQEALKKEKEAYDKAYEEEDFDRDLSKQQRELEEIAQQIAIYSRDTSEAGKARLEQLKKEYEAQQEAINELIRDKEKDKTDERFDEVSDALDKELEDILDPQKLVSIVNDAISSGMITIGEETMHINELMSNWLNDTGDGLYALGDVLQSELLDNLKEAQTIISELKLNGFNNLLGSTINVPNYNSVIEDLISSTSKASKGGDINFSLVVQGDVTKDTMPEIEKQLNSMEKRIYNNIAKNMK